MQQEELGALLIKIFLANKHLNFLVTAGNDESILALKEIGVKDNQIINYKTEDVEVSAFSKNNNRKFDFVVVDLVGNEIGRLYLDF